MVFNNINKYIRLYVNMYIKKLYLVTKNELFSYICIYLFLFAMFSKNMLNSLFFCQGEGWLFVFCFFFRLCSTKLFVFFLNNFLYILVVCILDINTKQIHITYFINVCICNVVSMFSFFCLNFLLQFLIFSFFFLLFWCQTSSLFFQDYSYCCCCLFFKDI